MYRQLRGLLKMTKVKHRVNRDKYEWFVLRTHGQEEARADRELRNQGFKTFLPIARHVKHVGGRKIVYIGPLFPRYLFIKIKWSLRKPVVSTKGVKNFVGYYESSQKAPVVRDYIIRDLQARQEEVCGRLVINVDKPLILQEGDLVSVLFGPFKGQTSEVTAVHDNKIDIVVNLFGKQFPKTLQREALERLRIVA